MIPSQKLRFLAFSLWRRSYTWKLPRTTIELGPRTIVMGILNVTPDSFSEGRDNVDPVRARDRAHQIEAQGADILDVGAESTKPGGTPVDAAEEMRRLGPVLELLAASVKIPISVDTYRAATARAAIDAGAQINQRHQRLSPRFRDGKVGGRNGFRRRADAQPRGPSPTP